jgi:hypothetical protein
MGLVLYRARGWTSPTYRAAFNTRQFFSDSWEKHAPPPYYTRSDVRRDFEGRIERRHEKGPCVLSERGVGLGLFTHLSGKAQAALSSNDFAESDMEQAMTAFLEEVGKLLLESLLRPFFRLLRKVWLILITASLWAMWIWLRQVPVEEPQVQVTQPSPRRVVAVAERQPPAQPLRVRAEDQTTALLARANKLDELLQRAEARALRIAEENARRAEQMRRLLEELEAERLRRRSAEAHARMASTATRPAETRAVSPAESMRAAPQQAPVVVHYAPRAFPVYVVHEDKEPFEEALSALGFEFRSVSLPSPVTGPRWHSVSIRPGWIRQTVNGPEQLSRLLADLAELERYGLRVEVRRSRIP